MLCGTCRQHFDSFKIQVFAAQEWNLQSFASQQDLVLRETANSTKTGVHAPSLFFTLRLNQLIGSSLGELGFSDFNVFSQWF